MCYRYVDYTRNISNKSSKIDFILPDICTIIHSLKTYSVNSNDVTLNVYINTEFIYEVRYVVQNIVSFSLQFSQQNAYKKIMFYFIHFR